MFPILVRKTLINFSLIFTCLLSVALIAYHIAYQNKIYPGVRVAGIHIGNLTQEEAEGFLAKKLQEFQAAELSIQVVEKTKKYKLEAIGLKLDPKETAQEAYLLGRRSNLLSSFKEKIVSWQRGTNLGFKVEKDVSRFDQFITNLKKEVDRKPLNAQVTLESGEVILKPSESGRTLNSSLAKEQVLTYLANLNSNINLPLETIKPEVTEERAQDAFKKVKSLSEKNFFFHSQGRRFPISKEKLVSLLTITPEKQEVVPSLSLDLGKTNFVVLSYARSNEEEVDTKQLKVSLSKELSNSFVSSLAKQVNRPSVNAKFSFKDGKVEGFTPHSEGLLVDELASLDNLQKSLDNGKEDITLAVKVIPPQITNESVNDLGIKELLGRGSSKFAGSIPNRIHNISLGASRVNGTLVAPGEVFSLYKTIGEVDQNTDYKEAYVIIGKRTELDWGGGICQVSTTLFRAALNAGLPIIERNPHAYRVGYYEQAGDPGGGSPGVDASVFFPRSDFRFKNDTANNILIQTVIDPKNSYLAFEIYGTSDNRKVQIAKPIVTNQIKPPDSLYQDDLALNKGEKKQVDFSAWGANTVFSRTVTRGGEKIISDTFYTKYRPWQAIFLVGTKDPNAPPPPSPEATPSATPNQT